MINRLSIRNFQSLKSADLDLGTFTVIVGPSSSGKSALIRAVRALASNVRGTGQITRGQKNLAITAHTDTAVVTLERGERSGLYRLTDAHGEQIFTKLGAAVPGPVTAALRIEPAIDTGSVNFAGQFDKPYLLDESGAVVARQLGELTNVSVIFEAVRAANRARANAASVLKTRRADLTLLTSRLADFTGLGDRLKALDEAEELNARRVTLTARAARLGGLIAHAASVERTLATALPPVVPDAAVLNQKLNRLLELKSKLNRIDTQRGRLRTASTEYDAADHGLAHLEFELRTALVRAKVCPTCGQATAICGQATVE